MYSILLDQIKSDTKGYAEDLNRYDSVLDDTKKQIFELRKDTGIRHVFRDSVLRASFRPQLQRLRQKWKRADSLIKSVNVLIDNILARTSNNLLAINELKMQARGLIETIGSKAFTKESRYLWESRSSQRPQLFSGQFKKNLDSERKITLYYFTHSHYQLNLLVLCGLVFFLWVFFNFRSLKKFGKLATLQPFQFLYINALPFLASLLFILNIAPLFDLNAPVIYIDTIEFSLMVVLTFLFLKRHLQKNFISGSFL